MKYKKIIAIFCVVLVLCGIGYVVYGAVNVSISADKQYMVDGVIDGDTFKVKIGWHIVTVRMLGIDTPETVHPRKPMQCYAQEASDATKKLLTGQSVRLILNPNREVQDRYQRYLAYVYIGNSISSVNEYLLENGFARVYTYGKPYMMQNEFMGIENIAKENKVGLWSMCEQ